MPKYHQQRNLHLNLFVISLYYTLELPRYPLSPLCAYNAPGHCTWEGRLGAKVRFSPGPGHAASVHQAVSRELYLWHLRSGHQCLAYPGHWSPLCCVKPAD